MHHRAREAKDKSVLCSAHNFLVFPHRILASYVLAEAGRELETKQQISGDEDATRLFMATWECSYVSRCSLSLCNFLSLIFPLPRFTISHKDSSRKNEFNEAKQIPKLPVFILDSTMLKQIVKWHFICPRCETHTKTNLRNFFFSQMAKKG